MARSLLLALAAPVCFAAACAGDPAAAPAGRALAITIAPLDLAGVVDATWTLTVKNESGATVWTRTITAGAYGDGAGSVSYVGPCDADDDPNADGAATNRVELALVALAGEDGPLTAGVDFHNPAPAALPVARTGVCRADADTPVAFDVTIARRAQQGFFDVAISFDNIFCSAKLDCRRDSNGDGQLTAADAPLALLFDATGARATTVVLGLACTGGLGAANDTVLYRTPVTVSCAGGHSATVVPDAGQGLVAHGHTGTDPLFAAAVYAGDELLAGFNKRYWNVALGLAGGASCAVSAGATAKRGGFPSDTSPADSPWPVVRWSVPLTDGAGALSCTGHALDAGAGVATGYETGVAFAARYPFALGTALAPADSCREILAARPTAPSGLYWVDPLGAGPFQLYCDMAAGGWGLVYRATNAAGTNQIGTVTQTGPIGATPILPGSTGHYKLADDVINALRSTVAGVTGNLRMSLYKGAPLALMSHVWHRSTCVLDTDADHPSGHACLDSNKVGPSFTGTWAASTHHGSLSRWYVDPAIGYIWGAVGTHIGSIPGATYHGGGNPTDFCTWYDSRTCPADTAMELWVY